MQLQSASQEQIDNYQTSQTEVLKIKEHLLEAQGDKKSLATDFEKLKAEMSQLSTASDTSGDMATVLGELLGQFRGEQIRLEDDIKCISEKLEYAESAYTAVAMNAEKLAAENAHMKAELAKSHGNHAQATILPPIRASGQDSTVQFLVAERARLERELAKANGTLGTILSSFSSYPMASLTSPDASDTAGNIISQTNRALAQAKEPARNWDFINANGPVSEMKATNTTINTSEPNANTFKQAPSGNAKNCIWNTNSWGPDVATLAPSTAVDTNDWSFAVPGRIPSPSGSVESEL